MKIPRDVRKQDLYDYISALHSKKKDTIIEETQKQLDEHALDEKVYSEVKTEVELLDSEFKKFIRDMEDFSENTIELFKSRFGNGYSFSQVLYHGNGFSFVDKLKKHLDYKYRHPFKHDKGKLQYMDSKDGDSELVTKVKAQFNEISSEHNNKISEVMKVRTQLNDLVKGESRGSSAWKKLEETGLNMTDLRMKLTSQEKSSVPSIIINANVELFNAVSIFDKETKNESN
jgi:hypothetical protein